MKQSIVMNKEGDFFCSEGKWSPFWKQAKRFRSPVQAVSVAAKHHGSVFQNFGLSNEVCVWDYELNMEVRNGATYGIHNR